MSSNIADEPSAHVESLVLWFRALFSPMNIVCVRGAPAMDPCEC